MKICITGSLGLVGSEAVKFYQDHEIIGIDNNQRSKWFFTPTAPQHQQKGYTHYSTDIRDYKNLSGIFLKHKFDYILHCAAQPSHDFAAKIPIDDFEINTKGTLNLLELTRQYSPEAVFVYVSTNKVYGDTPNKIKLRTINKRYSPVNLLDYWDGIDESMSIDKSLHSLFGCSKTAADLYAQEYGHYFGLKTGVFRGGCLTGPKHAGTELHGFLNYLVKCVKHDQPYTIYGTGYQVRDNIHSHDLINAFEEFRKNPRCGEVYNIGGGTYSNCSIWEAIEILNNIRAENGLSAWDKYKIEEDNWRIGDHKWYISDVGKFQKHYPDWKYTYNIEQIIRDIYDSV